MGRSGGTPPGQGGQHRQRQEVRWGRRCRAHARPGGRWTGRCPTTPRPRPVVAAAPAGSQPLDETLPSHPQRRDQGEHHEHRRGPSHRARPPCCPPVHPVGSELARVGVADVRHLVETIPVGRPPRSQQRPHRGVRHPGRLPPHPAGTVDPSHPYQGRESAAAHPMPRPAPGPAGGRGLSAPRRPGAGGRPVEPGRQRCSPAWSGPRCPGRRAGDEPHLERGRVARCGWRRRGRRPRRARCAPRGRRGSPASRSRGRTRSPTARRRGRSPRGRRVARASRPSPLPVPVGPRRAGPGRTRRVRGRPRGGRCRRPWHRPRGGGGGRATP